MVAEVQAPGALFIIPTAILLQIEYTICIRARCAILAVSVKLLVE